MPCCKATFVFWLVGWRKFAAFAFPGRCGNSYGSSPLSSRRTTCSTYVLAFAHRDTTFDSHCPNEVEPYKDHNGVQTIDPLGPPSRLRELKVGKTLRAFRLDRNKQDHAFQVERVASRPHIFLFRGLLSELECQEIIQAATADSKMETAETASGESSSKRRNCQVAWLSNDSADGLVGNLAVTVGRLVLSTTATVSGPGAGYEDMQVVHYTEGGEYVLHHDGNERVVTVLYYLTDVGATWFPLVSSNNSGDNSANKESFRGPKSREEALKLAEYREPGTDGVLLTSRAGATADDISSGRTTNNSLITIRTGDAVVFYNYYSHNGDRATMDWTSLHAGLPVAAPDKWIANHWYHPSDHFFCQN